MRAVPSEEPVEDDDEEDADGAHTASKEESAAAMCIAWWASASLPLRPHVDSTKRKATVLHQDCTGTNWRQQRAVRLAVATPSPRAMESGSTTRDLKEEEDEVEEEDGDDEEDDGEESEDEDFVPGASADEDSAEYNSLFGNHKLLVDRVVKRIRDSTQPGLLYNVITWGKRDWAEQVFVDPLRIEP